MMTRMTRTRDGMETRNARVQEGRGCFFVPSSPCATIRRPRAETASRGCQDFPGPRAGLGATQPEVEGRVRQAEDARGHARVSPLGARPGDVRACLNALQMLSQEGRGLTMADVHGGGGGGAGRRISPCSARRVGSAPVRPRRQRRTRREARDALAACAQIASSAATRPSRGLVRKRALGAHAGFLHGEERARSPPSATRTYFAGARSSADTSTSSRTSRRRRWRARVRDQRARRGIPRLAAVVQDAPRPRAETRRPQGMGARRARVRGARRRVGPHLTETCSYLLSCVAPEIRPVAANFMKPHEAELLRATVSTMANAGLTYAAPVENQSFGALRGAHQVQLVLDPPVDRVCEFGAGVRDTRSRVRRR